MAISKIKLLIPQKLNIKMTCRGALRQSSVGKEFVIYNQRMCLWKKVVSLKLLIRSSLKLFIIQIW